MSDTGIVLVGGGIGGLSAALALSQQGQATRVLEQAAEIKEVGAGIQLGPNATRILRQWGLLDQLLEVAAQPQRLQVNSINGEELGCMQLGRSFEDKYAAPYISIHRADLQNALLKAVQQYSIAQVQTDCRITKIEQPSPQLVQLSSASGQEFNSELVIGCDGLWSVARDYISPSPVVPTEHLAWRCLIAADDIADKMLLNQVSLWMGSKVHLVCYPVRQGTLLNVVVMTHGNTNKYNLKPHQAWDFASSKADLLQQLTDSCGAVQDIVHAGQDWRAWVLYHRPVLYRANQYTKGRVALLGDAAHPTRPHLAQGAVMAIEDAHGLALQLRGAAKTELTAALWQYALQRSKRNARIQLRSQFNGNIFQLGAPFSYGRDLAIKLGGEKLLDMPWLYGYQAQLNDGC